MATRYMALLDGVGNYGIVFPDLPGCTAMGRSMDEVLRNAAEALAEWVQHAVEQGRIVPQPRSAESLMADETVRQELENGAAFLVVPLVRELGRPVKANLSLDAGLLQAIDDAAEARGLSRSAFLASAAREKILSEA